MAERGKHDPACTTSPRSGTGHRHDGQEISKILFPCWNRSGTFAHSDLQQASAVVTLGILITSLATASDRSNGLVGHLVAAAAMATFFRLHLPLVAAVRGKHHTADVRLPGSWLHLQKQLHQQETNCHNCHRNGQDRFKRNPGDLRDCSSNIGSHFGLPAS